MHGTTAGRANHRGWIVVESIASDDGGFCVDFFTDSSGGCGYAHFRSDTEDQGRWTIIGDHHHRRHGTMTDACEAAVDNVRWLCQHPGASAALEAWRASL